jgi:hypothetical protein
MNRFIKFHRFENFQQYQQILCIKGENMLRHYNFGCTYSTKSPLHQYDFAFKLNDYNAKTHPC